MLTRLAHTRLTRARLCLARFVVGRRGPGLASTLAVVVLALLLTGCGGGSGGGSGGASNDLKDFDGIDKDAWAAALAELGEVRADPDLKELYDLTVEDCAKTAEDLELGLTLSGARPDLMRVNMKYVCPDKAHVIDEALENIQDRAVRFDEACQTSKEMRTEEQQNMVEAVGCP